jgi:hypothetical protein
MESLIENHQYLALLIGTFLEGETILVLGSVSIVGLLIWIFHFYPRPRRPAKFITESR